MAIDSLSLDSSLSLSSTAAQTAADAEETEAFKAALEEAQESEDLEAIKDVCKEFESLFINMLLKQMRNTIPDGGLIEKSQAREMFESMLDEKISLEIAEGGGLGIADMMVKNLTSSYDTFTDTSDSESTDEIDEQIFDVLSE